MLKRCDAPGCIFLAEYLLQVQYPHSNLKIQKFSCSMHLWFWGEVGESVYLNSREKDKEN